LAVAQGYSIPPDVKAFDLVASPRALMAVCLILASWYEKKELMGHKGNTRIKEEQDQNRDDLTLYI